MKIIIKNKDQELCYIQIRDLIILAKITQDNSLIKNYLSLINNGHQDFEFLPLKDKRIVRIVKNLPDIIDFRSSKNDSIEYLSERIISLYLLKSRPREKQIKDLTANDLRDIIAYKRGELSYQIPALPDGNLHLENLSLNLEFDSTILEDCYLLRSLTKEDLNTIDYSEFLNSSLNQVYQTYYPTIPKEEITYQSYNQNDHLILRIQPPKEKKKSRIDKILSKLKRSSN